MVEPNVTLTFTKQWAVHNGVSAEECIGADVVIDDATGRRKIGTIATMEVKEHELGGFEIIELGLDVHVGFEDLFVGRMPSIEVTEDEKFLASDFSAVPVSP